MNDPHVEKLHYKLIHDDSTDYKSEAYLRVEEDEFTITLDPQGATIEMKAHCATEQEARALVEPYVDCWTAYATLQEGPGQFGLEFKDSEIIDRQPIPGVVHVPLRKFKLATYPPSIHMLRGSFSEPPNGFKLSPYVNSMILQYSEYKKGREKLTSMAYFCLTVIEISAANSGDKGNGFRKAAAKKYNIEFKVLDKLGELTAKGSETDARKAQRGGNIPLQGNESAWIGSVLKAIILRLGEYEFDPSGQFQQITMADFPQL